MHVHTVLHKNIVSILPLLLVGVEESTGDLFLEVGWFWWAVVILVDPLGLTKNKTH